MTETETDAAESTALFQPPAPKDVLLKEGGLDAFINDVIQPAIDGFEIDLTTVKGRKAITSFAFKITRTATFLDAIGKEENEAARAQINVVDAARRAAMVKLKTLRDGFRKPLDDWEAAEAERINRVAVFFSGMRDIGRISEIDTSVSVAQRRETLTDATLDPELFRESLEEATEARQDALDALEAALPRLKQAEADRAELAKLRAAQVERNREDAERAAEQQRILAAVKKAEEDAEREAAELTAAYNRAAAAADRERQRILDEQAVRAADEKHRQTVIDAAKKGLMTFGRLTDEQATGVVLALLSQQIPYVTLNF